MKKKKTPVENFLFCWRRGEGGERRNPKNRRERRLFCPGEKGEEGRKSFCRAAEEKCWPLRRKVCRPRELQKTSPVQTAKKEGKNRGGV